MSEHPRTSRPSLPALQAHTSIMSSQNTTRKNTPSDPPTLPFTVRLQLAFGLPLAILRGVFHPSNKHRSWRAAIQWSATRYMIGRSWRTPREMAVALGVPTGEVYKTWAKGAKVEVRTEAVEVDADGVGHGGKLHWIGEKTLGKVVLHFHGGGFVLGPMEAMFAALYALKEDLRPTVGDVGFVALEYTLVPDAPFPTQLAQATAAINHLITLGVSPSDLVLSGDSAGGNLVLQVLSHLLHPLTHPSVPPPPKLSAPLGGALLISPWVHFGTSDPSFTSNAEADIVPPSGWANLARGCIPEVTEELRAYVEPARAPAGWWGGLGGVVRRVLVTAGERESLVDMVVKMGSALQEGE
ncbi:Alpha/Beta hydrolase protein, partial [Amylostereum chailletii]